MHKKIAVTYAICVLSCLGVTAYSVANSKVAQQPLHPGDMAQPAADFLSSIGVNSSVSRRGEVLDSTAAAIKYTGMRWLRTGYEGNIPIADLITLHNKTGIKYSYGLLSGGTDIPLLLAGGRALATAGALLAFEGNNEPNNWGIEYHGSKGGGQASWLAVAQLLRNMYAAVKGDKDLKGYPVFSISENGAQTDNVGLQYLTIPQKSNILMPHGTQYADFANCHNYITHPAWPGLHDNQTWNAASPGPDSHVDGLYGNYGNTWRKKFAGYNQNQLVGLPRVTTETGLTIGDGVSEDAHGKLLVNMYLAQFARGWRYTAAYLLRDRSDEGGNQQFGFYKTDYKPRKAAVYLHNLTTILADVPQKIHLKKLAFQIHNQPPTVHHLLLQKASGVFELIIWGERVQGQDVVQLKLAAMPRSVQVYDVTTGVKPVLKAGATQVVDLTLTDHPLVVEVKP